MWEYIGRRRVDRNEDGPDSERMSVQDRLAGPLLCLYWSYCVSNEWKRYCSGRWLTTARKMIHTRLSRRHNSAIEDNFHILYHIIHNYKSYVGFGESNWERWEKTRCCKEPNGAHLAKEGRNILAMRQNHDIEQVDAQSNTYRRAHIFR